MYINVFFASQRNERIASFCSIDSQRTRTTTHRIFTATHKITRNVYTKDAQWQFNEANHDKWLMGFFSLFSPFIFYSRFIFLFSVLRRFFFLHSDFARLEFVVSVFFFPNKFST